MRTERSRWAAALALALWVLCLLGLGVTAWFDHLLRQAGRPDLAQLGAGGVTLVLGAVSAATAGAVLASRRPRHPVGWLLLAFALLPQALTNAAEGYARYGLLVRPGGLPAASYLAVLASVTFIPGLGLLGFILLLTPTGSLPSSRWRWWARVAAAVPAAFLVSWLLGVPQLDPESPLRAIHNPMAIPALVEPLRTVYGTASPATAITLVVAAASLVLRFRRARGVERQQLRWLTLAAALAPLAVLATAAGIVTEHLALAGWAALAVAGVFQPARRRVQRAVDRRFNRRGYDAAMTIAAFSARLRQQIDLDTLTTELLAVVDQAMQPTQAALWLRRAGPPERAAR